MKDVYVNVVSAQQLDAPVFFHAGRAEVFMSCHMSNEGKA